MREWRYRRPSRYDSFVATRRARLTLALLALLGCNRLSGRHAPDASPAAVTDAASAASSTASEANPPDDEEEAPLTDGGGPCPIPIHPGYCRHRCRDFPTRQAMKHAKRVGHAARVGFGTCGAFKVFAEDERAGDAGVQSGVVEYYDGEGALVGAIDTRLEPCGRFGQIPACAPAVTWEAGHSVTVREGAVTVRGSLPPEVIERIVRQNFGRFRLCALRSQKPTQEGRVVTKLVIARDGSVTSAQDDGSDLTDKDVTACVVHAFSGLSFPQPEGGPVTATVPIVFSR